MGEKIKDLGRINLCGSDCAVEMNEPPSGCGERQIHVQSKTFRSEMTESEFVQFCAAIRLAAEKLRRLKSLP